MPHKNDPLTVETLRQHQPLSPALFATWISADLCGISGLIALNALGPHPFIAILQGMIIAALGAFTLEIYRRGMHIRAYRLRNIKGYSLGLALKYNGQTVHQFLQPSDHRQFLKTHHELVSLILPLKARGRSTIHIEGIPDFETRWTIQITYEHEIKILLQNEREPESCFALPWRDGLRLLAEHPTKTLTEIIRTSVLTTINTYSTSKVEPLNLERKKTNARLRLIT